MHFGLACAHNHHTKQKNDNEQKKPAVRIHDGPVFILALWISKYSHSVRQFLFLLCIAVPLRTVNDAIDRCTSFCTSIRPFIFIASIFRFQSHDNVVVNCSNRSLLPNNQAHTTLSNAVRNWCWFSSEIEQHSSDMNCYTLHEDDSLIAMLHSCDDQLDVEHNSYVSN